MMIDGLAWEVRSRGNGPTLVLLHGFMGRGASWGRHATALAARFRVVVVDLPGHGRSGIPADIVRASVERTAEDLAVILGRIDPEAVDVLGYSLGARIALRLAVDHPSRLRRLVLESPSAGIASDDERRERRQADEARARRLERSGVGPFVDEWERQPIFASRSALPPRTTARIRADRLRNRPAGLAISLRGAGQGSMVPLFDRLGDVAVPTLVLAGALDTTGKARAAVVAGGIPAARLEVIPGVGHAPHLEAPTTFRSLVRSFLEEDLAA
jgi:2-succinyl-6-hydroxy-2,4-cyclohexadiene-1-carboxylate synthase